MTEDVLIQWTGGEAERGAPADMTVFVDGRVRLSARLGGGEHRLAPDELAALRRLVFEDESFQAIDQAALDSEVAAAAAAARRRRSTAAATYVTGPDRDAGTSRLRAERAGVMHEVSHHDLAGDAHRYPEAETLQRLRRIELKLLELAERVRRRRT